MTTFTQGTSGTVTPAGSLARGATKNIAGSVTPAGSRTDNPGKSLAGTVAPTGTLSFQITKALAGSVSPTAALVRATAKHLVGSVSPSGVLHTIHGPIVPQQIADTLYDQSGDPFPGAFLIATLDLVPGTSLTTADGQDFIVPEPKKVVADASGNINFYLISPADMLPETLYLITLFDPTGKYMQQFYSTVWGYSATPKTLAAIRTIASDPTKVPFYYVARNTDGSGAEGIPLTVSIDADSSIAGFPGMVSQDAIQTCVTDSFGIGRGVLVKSSLLDAGRHYIVSFGQSASTVLARKCPDVAGINGFDILDPAFSYP